MVPLINISSPFDIPFASLSIADQHNIEHVAPVKREVISYMVSDYPRLENSNQFNLLYSFANYKEIAFSKNQQHVISIASKLFQNSVELNSDELNVLAYTMKRTRKTVSTLPGRK